MHKLATCAQELAAWEQSKFVRWLPLNSKMALHVANKESSSELKACS